MIVNESVLNIFLNISNMNISGHISVNRIVSTTLEFCHSVLLIELARIVSDIVNQLYYDPYLWVSIVTNMQTGNCCA